MGIFDKIDFNNLPENYNEEDVRADIIEPLLKILGYSRFDNDDLICNGKELNIYDRKGK